MTIAGEYKVLYAVAQSLFGLVLKR
jgi:hypothetical protein